MAQKAEKNWKAWGLIALCVVLAAWSFGLLYEGFFADHYLGFFTYPFVDEPAAERAYQRLAPNAPIAERAIAAQRLIEADPTNPDSWNAIAYVEYAKAGRLSPKALEALDHSYAVSFFDPTGGIWRISFALENWPALTPALRANVTTEATVMLKDPTLGPRLKAQLLQIHNPAGRMAAMFMLPADALPKPPAAHQ